VLKNLESNIHYSATVFPGSSIKRDIDLNIFTRPIQKYNLECEYSKGELIEKFQFVQQGIPIPKLFYEYRTWGITNLVCILVIPFVGLNIGGVGIIPGWIIACTLCWFFFLDNREITKAARMTI